MDWIVSQKDIEAEILKIEQSFVDSIVMCNKIISYCQKVLEIYRQEVMEKGFLDETSEIKFFKQDKQIPLSFIIQYAKQLAFELDFQKIAPGMDHQFIARKIEDPLYVPRFCDVYGLGTGSYGCILFHTKT